MGTASIGPASRSGIGYGIGYGTRSEIKSEIRSEIGYGIKSEIRNGARTAHTAASRGSGRLPRKDTV